MKNIINPNQQYLEEIKEIANNQYRIQLVDPRFTDLEITALKNKGKIEIIGYTKRDDCLYNNGAGAMHSDINEQNKCSLGYKNCQGFVIAGVDKYTNEPISMITHHEPPNAMNLNYYFDEKGFIKMDKILKDIEEKEFYIYDDFLECASKITDISDLVNKMTIFTNVSEKIKNHIYVNEHEMNEFFGFLYYYKYYEQYWKNHYFNSLKSKFEEMKTRCKKGSIDFVRFGGNILDPEYKYNYEQVVKHTNNLFLEVFGKHINQIEGPKVTLNVSDVYYNTAERKLMIKYLYSGSDRIDSLRHFIGINPEMDAMILKYRENLSVYNNNISLKY